MRKILDLLINGETRNIEFKKEYTDKIFKTISAFANYNTGKIFIGVDDDGNISGVNDTKEMKIRIENAINDKIKPRPYYEIISEEIQGKEIIIITIYNGENMPYTLNNIAYKRMDTSTIPVERLEYETLVLRGRNLTFEIMEFEGEKLRFSYLGRKLDEYININKISIDTLKSIELIINDKYVNAAALIADNNPIVTSSVVLIRYEGNSVLNIRDRELLVGISILEQFDVSMNFFKKHINISEIIRGAYRETIEEVPLVAYRESIANAIVHRDYLKQGDIKVEIFDDRIEIVSPGTLPPGILKNEFLEGRISIPRNRIIANIFARLKIIERFATGIRRIKECYKDYDKKPEFDISENTIKVILPKQKIKNNKAIISETILETKEDIIVSEVKIIEYLKLNESITRSEAEKLLDLKKTQTVKILSELKGKNLIVSEGGGSKIKYKLK